MSTPTYDPKKLTSRHRLIMYALVLEGMALQECADKFELSIGYLRNIRNAPLWKKEEDKLRAEVLSGHKTELQKLIPGAIVTLKSVMENPINPPSARANAATAVLDRAGLSRNAELTEAPKGVVINLFKPPWDAPGQQGQVVEITMDDEESVGETDLDFEVEKQKPELPAA